LYFGSELYGTISWSRKLNEFEKRRQIEVAERKKPEV
jgi:hypothetical protein